MDGLHGIFPPDTTTRTEVQNMINSAGFATQSYVTSRGYVTSNTVSSMISSALSGSSGTNVKQTVYTLTDTSKTISVNQNHLYIIAAEHNYYLYICHNGTLIKVNGPVASGGRYIVQMSGSSSISARTDSDYGWKLYLFEFC